MTDLCDDSRARTRRRPVMLPEGAGAVKHAGAAARPDDATRNSYPAEMLPAARAPRPSARTAARRAASLAALGLAALAGPVAAAPAAPPHGVRWRLADSHVRELVGPRSAVLDHDPRGGPRQIALHDLVSGRMLRDLADLWDPRTNPPELLASPTALVLVLGAREIAAIHPTTGALLMRTDLTHGTQERPRPLAVLPGAEGRDLVLLAEGANFRALDLRTGAERWKAPRADSGLVPWSSFLAADGVLLGRTDDWRLSAVDAATGRALWLHPDRTQTGAPVLTFAIDGPRAAYSTPQGAVRVVDAATNAARTSLAVTSAWSRLVRLALRGETLFVEHAYRLEAWDIATQTRRYALDIGGGEVELGERAVYVCAPTGEVTAHALADGAALWELGLGACRFHWPRETVIVEDPAGDSAITSRLEVVARALPPDPPREVLVFGRAWLDGHVLADTPIRVGRETARTDREGRFRARVTVSGRVRVEVEPGLGRRGRTPCLRGVAEEVEFTPGVARRWVSLREFTERRAYCEGE